MVTGTLKSLEELLDNFLEVDPEDKKYVLLTQQKINNMNRPHNPVAHNQHIFEVDSLGKIFKSNCGKFEVARDYATEYGNLLKAPEMRQKAANIGRPVCGTCVSALYGGDD